MSNIIKHFLYTLPLFLLITNTNTVKTSDSISDYIRNIADFSYLYTISESDKNNTSTGIRCFWLESETLSVFDIKGLKRKFSQH